MDTFIEDIRKGVKALDDKQRVLFAALTCEKMYSNYLAFSKLENWGEPDVFEKGVALLYQYTFRPDLIKDDEIQEAKEDLDAIIPDTDDFSGNLTSYAVDACSAIYDALDYLLTKNTELIVNVATYARDTVDMYVQEKEDMDPNDRNLETKIAADAFMIAEKNRQEELIKVLKNVTEITSDLVERLRLSSNRQQMLDITLLP